jgi:hypothetical protein
MITRLAFIVLCSIAALGCAKTQMDAGTDGATHFLIECERDGECGELSCLCGVCSKPCDGDAQCSALNDDADCGPSAASCEAAEQSCVVDCADDDACEALGANARCEAGRCVRSAPPASIDAGGSGACQAMDARSNGNFCERLVGFAWNGSNCDDIQCGCAGSECDDVYPTRAACERAYAQCAPPCSRMQAESGALNCGDVTGFTWTGIECSSVLCGCEGDDCGLLYSTEDECESAHRQCAPLSMCSRPTDCALVDEQCCRCTISPEDFVSIAAADAADHNARVCEPGQACPDCAVVPPSYLTPTCEPSTRWEGGECGKLQLDGLPCTAEVGCRVRASECCECAVDTSVENLFAMPNGFDAEELFCGSGDGCCEGEPNYPENVEARCEESQCVLYVDGARLNR